MFRWEVTLFSGKLVSLGVVDRGAAKYPRLSRRLGSSYPQESLSEGIGGKIKPL
jgi:hypothetical protein